MRMARFMAALAHHRMYLYLLPALLLAQSNGAIAQSALDLSGATVVTPAGSSKQERKAVEMLVDEIEKRTTIALPIVNEAPAGGPSIVVGSKASLESIAAQSRISLECPEAAEGFALRFDAASSRVSIVGADARGVLFGVGRLLRELHMSEDTLTLAPGLAISTSPEVPLRGHQVGYRPKVNTYDGWTPPFWEQYIRDMAVFGANAIEMIPPRSDDDADSPHFPLPQIEMMAIISQICDDYGIDVWIWYPAMEKDNSDPATVQRELKAWGEVFEKMPRIDAIFVPGGDPGHTQPKHMMALLEKQTEVLHRSHPNAEMWMSPQGFTAEWMDEFVAIMQNEQPKWLTGVVFGPQNRLSLADTRASVPKQYKLRHYPDITHTYSCQFPVQDWDVAYKLTQDREVINPRPRAQAEIYRWSLPYTGGFLTYSEGVNDDVNKFVWSGLGWDSKTDVHQILREYARYFIGPEFEDPFSKALFALERNWEGPLIANTGVMTTLQQVRDMERAASPQVLLNWRFQQVVYRAHYDAYVRRRLIYETALEEEAMDVLRRAKTIGSLLALDAADDILNRAFLEPVGQDLRSRVSDMAEALYQSIRMQLSVPRFHAIDVGRGANFDLIDRPINNVLWLRPQFEAIRAMDNEKDRLAKIDSIINWTNPGPGGFYDDLGDPLQQPHLVRKLTDEFDPENRTNPLLGYTPRFIDGRISWFCDAETRFEAPLKMKYPHLDPNAAYKVRVIYAGDKFDTQMRLLADETIEVHPFIDKKFPLEPVEFDIPVEATRDGELTLTWYQTPGRGSAGRGCQVTEVWLIRK